MKKLFVFIFCFLLIFSTIRSARGQPALSTNSFFAYVSSYEWDVEAFTNTCSEFVQYKDSFSWDDVTFDFSWDAFDTDDVGEWFSALGNMFLSFFEVIGDFFVYVGNFFVLIGIAIASVFALLFDSIQMLVNCLQLLLRFFGFLG